MPNMSIPITALRGRLEMMPEIRNVVHALEGESRFFSARAQRAVEPGAALDFAERSFARLGTARELTARYANGPSQAHVNEAVGLIDTALVQTQRAVGELRAPGAVANAGSSALVDARFTMLSFNQNFFHASQR